jgi:predicted TPR repeat methyltransferase
MQPEPLEQREVTLQEAMSIAILFQKNGELGDAEDIYRKVLENFPGHPDALHFLGVLQHQKGESEAAIELIRRSIAIEPGQADVHSNLGIVLKAKGRVDEAMAAYRDAIALEPEHANAWSNLGILLKAKGQIADAEAAYRRAIEINPSHIDAYHNLGILLAGQRRTDEAVVCYCKVVTMNPQHAEARKLLALAYCTIGQRDKAIEIFERWVQEKPDDAVARHMLAACSGSNVPSRASNAYVEKTFDDFAASFDSKLAKLSYRAPSIVAAVLTDAYPQPSKQFDVLDAGCGTGLCGPLVVPYARSLVGVDLSGKMLDGASEKKVYDELVRDELTAYLAKQCARFDLIISADTLVYFGALEEVLRAAAAALRSEGLLIFTVEDSAADAALSDYQIHPHGRYSHSRQYIERALRAVGLVPQVVSAELRMEAGKPVAGLVVSARKTSSLAT